MTTLTDTVLAAEICALSEKAESLRGDILGLRAAALGHADTHG